MRLLPKPYEGLYDGLPAVASPGEQTEISSSLGTAAFFGLMRLGLGLAGFIVPGKPGSPRTLPWDAIMRITSYCTIGFLGTSVIQRSLEQNTASRFLRSHGIEQPRQKLADRLQNFDVDNAVIIGGLAGVFVASRRKQPWSVFGWKRQVGAFTFGSMTGNIAYGLYRRDRTGQRQSTAETEQDKKIHAQWSALIDRSWSFKMTYPPENTVSPHNAMKRTEALGSGAPEGSSQGNDSFSMLSDHGTGSDNIGRDGPHLTTTVPDERDPIPFANTNYAWVSKTPVQDLERHIDMLQQRRLKLAQEAEFLWAWLSEKEAEYYDTPGLDLKANKDSKEKFFLEFLGSHHTKTWLEASACDWMIADARKRLEQIKSRERDDKTTWRAGCSDVAAQTEPRFALRLLRGFEQAMVTMRTQLEQVKAQTSMDMADPGDEFDQAAKEKVFNPVQQKMTTQKEALIDMGKQVEEALEQTSLMEQAAREIIVEGEERYKNASQRKRYYWGQPPLEQAQVTIHRINAYDRIPAEDKDTGKIRKVDGVV